VFHFGDPVISAGIPWYTCPFGRDALLAGYESLLAAPEVARDALRFLARLQGKRDDPSRDEEPGKIPHEIRFGEMAVAGEVPHTPYYGSADATPLFAVLLDEYHLWTDDRETVEDLLPAAERAVEWIERYGDRDGDGLVEYERRTPSRPSRSSRCRATRSTRAGGSPRSTGAWATTARRSGSSRARAPSRGRSRSGSGWGARARTPSRSTATSARWTR
jgi:hypothetical protein